MSSFFSTYELSIDSRRIYRILTLFIIDVSWLSIHARDLDLFVRLSRLAGSSNLSVRVPVVCDSDSTKLKLNGNAANKYSIAENFVFSWQI